MQTKNCSPTNKVRLSTNLQPLTLDVLLVYEDLNSALRGQTLAHRLASGLKPTFELRTSVWKFEFLQHAQLREQARTEALSAKVIIFSACATRDLPPLVTDWIESWKWEKGRHQPGVLVFLGGGEEESEADEQASPARDYLREVSRVAGLDFFSSLGNSARPDFQNLLALDRSGESRNVAGKSGGVASAQHTRRHAVN